MKSSAIVFLLAAIASSAWAKSPRKSEITHIFCPATYVYVRTMDGDAMRPGVLPEDRDAAFRIEDKLSEWNRYVLVYQPQQADLVFVVRTGRLAAAQGTAGVGVGPRTDPGGPATPPAGRDPGDASQSTNTPNQPPAGRSGGNARWTGVGGEVGPPDDLLAIYMKPGDVNTQNPLWQQTEKDGLNGPEVPLFEQIRTAVDQACHDRPKPDQPKPNQPGPAQPKPDQHP